MTYLVCMCSLLISCSSGDGIRYRGEYKYNETTGEVYGNPAMSPRVKDIYNSIKNGAQKAKASGDVFRDHAEAMRIEDMRKMMQHSEKQYPIMDSPEDMVAAFKDKSREEVLEAAEQYMTRGYMASAFTLWTR